VFESVTYQPSETPPCKWTCAAVTPSPEAVAQPPAGTKQ
jgi:hypothetical protein